MVSVSAGTVVSEAKPCVFVPRMGGRHASFYTAVFGMVFMVEGAWEITGVDKSLSRCLILGVEMVGRGGIVVLDLC